jgi:hypothetical protein
MRARRPCSGTNVLRPHPGWELRPAATPLDVPRAIPRALPRVVTRAMISAGIERGRRVMRRTSWLFFGKRNVCLEIGLATRGVRLPPEPEPSLPRATRPRRSDDVATGLREREQGWVLGPSLPMAWSSWITRVQRHRLGRGTVRGVEGDGPAVSHMLSGECDRLGHSSLEHPQHLDDPASFPPSRAGADVKGPSRRLGPCIDGTKRGGGAEQGAPGRHALHKRSGRCAIARRLGQASRDRHPRSWED